MEKVIELLGIGMDDARAVGIWGMGGMGKTTIARAIYDHISSQFEGYSFNENVREVSAKSGLKTLQEQLISEILMEKDLKIGSVGSEVSMIRNMACRKKVLIVLDDVDESTELEKLVGEHHWFGFGSRIIITTRNQHALTRYGITHIYEVEELREYETIELFKLKAFGKHQQMEDYTELVHRAVKYAKGVPLALKVLGSFLCGRKKYEWESSLNKLKESPLNEVQQILRISYDELQLGAKKVEGIAVEYLDLGHQDPKDIGLKELKLRPKAFAKMLNLRILKMCFMHLTEDLKYLSNKLRYLDWCGYPMKCMPSTFQPERLIELHLTYSSIEQLWEGTTI
ncbi:hypothetical protein ACSBR2_028452 [Camellia fascicularis]